MVDLLSFVKLDRGVAQAKLLTNRHLRLFGRNSLLSCKQKSRSGFQQTDDRIQQYFTAAITTNNDKYPPDLKRHDQTIPSFEIPSKRLDAPCQFG